MVGKIPNQGATIFKGFYCEYLSRIEIESTQEIGRLLNDVSQAGANEIVGLTFRPNEEALAAAKTIALQSALKDVTNKASLIRAQLQSRPLYPASIEILEDNTLATNPSIRSRSASLTSDEMPEVM